MDTVSLSVIIPVLNEAKNLRILLPELFTELRALGKSFEVLVIDDASVDGTEGLLRTVSDAEAHLRGALLTRRFGKGAALALGARLSHGEALVTMDGDGQDVPAMIPRLLAAIDDGATLALGRRKQRIDTWHRRWISILANTIIGALLGRRGFSDFNTGLRAYRRSAILSTPHRGGMFRFTAFFLAAAGERVTEVPVRHRARTHGRTRFPLVRRLRVFSDLFHARSLIRVRRSGRLYPDDEEALRTISFREVHGGRVMEEQSARGLTAR